MTREEEIKLYLKERNIPIDSLEANSIIEGAQWADKTMLEKARMWLAMNMTDTQYIGINGDIYKPDFIQKFIKAMEE